MRDAKRRRDAARMGPSQGMEEPGQRLVVGGPAAPGAPRRARLVRWVALSCVLPLTLLACASPGPNSGAAAALELAQADSHDAVVAQTSFAPAVAPGEAREAAARGEFDDAPAADSPLPAPQPQAPADRKLVEAPPIAPPELSDLPAPPPATPTDIEPLKLPSIAGAAAPDPATPELPEAVQPDPAAPDAASDAPPDTAQPGARMRLFEHGGPAGPASRDDLWTRVRRGFAVPNLEGPRVRASERWYAARPEYVQRMTERSARYLFHIAEEVERRGLPSELALLPFIESAFSPMALSSARASGIWQFIASTGRSFDLKQNVFRDDRRDVLASTQAALDYLERLHSMFGDWHLALAAYNCGEGNVARAIARNRKARKPTDYASLRLPTETRQYVPKLQAVKNIVARPEAFGLVLPDLPDHPYFLSVPIDNDIDVELAATLAGLEAEEFRALNPQMNKPVILAAGTPQLLLPHDNANRFIRELPRHPGPLASWTAWVAPKNLPPGHAARQVGMSEAELRSLNQIRGRKLIKAGSTLLVPRRDARAADVSERLADDGKLVLLPEAGRRQRTAASAARSRPIARPMGYPIARATGSRQAPVRVRMR